MFDPIYTERIRIRIGNVNAGAPNDVAECRACVMQADPNAETQGQAKKTEKWVVLIPETEVMSFNKIAIGSVIEADTIKRAWPLMSVQKRPYMLAGDYVLECSARELGGRKL